MNFYRILITVFFCLTFQVHSQTYNFSVSTDTYSDLAGSTSLNNGITWDDPQYTVSIGFDFNYFDLTINHIFIEDYGLGGFLMTDTNETGVIPMLIPYGADIIDRGDLIDSSLSDISYLLDGNIGSRILKIEWKNVGFYSELYDDNVSNDYTNFQLWLYEGTDDIEIRFGDNMISQPSISFDGETGSFIGLIKGYDIDNDLFVGENILLEGAPTSPNTVQLAPDPDSMVYLNGVIPSGTVYKFSKGFSEISEQESQEDSRMLIYPNPAKDYVSLLIHDFNTQDITGIDILNMKGQVIKTYSSATNPIDILDLSSGVYYVAVHTREGIFVRKLMKD